ncbi:hypothetical protein Tco_0992997 [Tanacetum coccineum]|uniref:Uncharacterized protein n=1 Tax=Tanacetum coccineum TaxID=301880 RepID=A0ABQ5F3N7_9ASTR
MSTFIKNQSSWKLSQLKKLSFEELKTEFKKLMKSIESFVPMETEARVKRHGLQLEQETSKKQKIDIEDDSITKGKDKVVKEEEAEVPKDKVKDASSESEIGVDAIPTATKPPTVVNWKIIYQSSQKAAYQIIRRDGTDKSKITRKQSKTGKHGHENQKSTKRSQRIKAEAKNVKPQSKIVNHGQ